MLLGYNTNGFAHHRLEDALAILAELGYQSVALTLDHGALNPYDPDLRQQLDVVRRCLTRHHLHCVVETGARFLLDPRRKHQPTLLSAPEEAERRVDFLRRAVDIAAELEADAVSFWSGTARDVDEATAWIRLRDGCRRLCEHAATRQMRLAFEPEPGMLVDTMNRYALLHAEVDHPLFGLTLDVGHLHCLGELPVSEHVVRWAPWLWNVHIEDMRRGVHDHLMFGEGEMDFGDVFAGLRAVGYQGGVHVELSRHSHDAVETARRAIGVMRNFWPAQP